MTPEPMTPPDCDVRSFPYMPLDVVRLLDSDLFALSTGEEFKAALSLWARSWTQVPAASISADERVQARLVGVSLAEWRTLAPRALQGWQECADGRFYHPVVAEKALTAWLDKLSRQERSAKGNAAKYGREADTAAFAGQTQRAITCLARIAPSESARYGKLPHGDDCAPTGSHPASAGDSETLPTKQNGTEPNKTAPAVLPPDPNKEAWTRAVALLVTAGNLTGAGARSLFAKLLKAYALEARDLLPSVVKAEATGSPDPQSYLTAAAKAIAARRGQGLAPPAPTAREWSDDQWATAVRLFHEDSSWSADWGPTPDEPGCRAPGHLLKVVPIHKGTAA
jgi:hypothetical protein